MHGLNPPQRPAAPLVPLLLGLGIVLCTAAQCASPRGSSNGTSAIVDTITVEGDVTARGNEPFSAYVLETDERNFYVLELPDELADDFATPARIRVTGRLYRGEWEGRPFAHIDVARYEPLPR